MPYQPDSPHSHAHELAEHCNAWPFAEARELLKHLGGKLPEKGYVLFETGYGPSGLPHIGTFGEVMRTTMVRRAFELLTGMPTRLFAYSDDMDGLRKVPDNIPNKEMIREHLGKSLTTIPDPFGTHPSFGEHNNARLCAFLDQYGFEYEFKSATQEYKAGRLNGVLQKVLENYDKVMEIMLPSLREERAANYSPFLPVCPKTNKVLQTRVVETRPEQGTIVYEDEDGKLVETDIKDGKVKLQWKADWGGRWVSLNVDYEMSGKDLIDSVKLASRICRTLGGTPPLNLTYELFLDEKGQKISKSKGNGLSMEDWLRYATPESLALFMYQKPKTAKRLYFDVIPKTVDDYLSHLSAFGEQEEKDQLNNPLWHIHAGHPPAPEAEGMSFNILLNLASVCHAEDKGVLWQFITRYRADATPENSPILDTLVGYAITYYRDFVKPNKKFRAANDIERQALEELKTALQGMAAETSAEDIQTEVYEVGKRHGFENLRDWFKTCYEVLLGQSEGPRMGSFIALYGIPESIELIDKALKGENL